MTTSGADSRSARGYYPKQKTGGGFVVLVSSTALPTMLSGK